LVHCRLSLYFSFFSFTDPAPTAIYTLSLHDALPISHARPGRQRPDAEGRDHGDRGRLRGQQGRSAGRPEGRPGDPLDAQHGAQRSEEHTSELQSPYDLVCRLLLEKKKKIHNVKTNNI